MGNELVAIYYICSKKYYIYGCWDKETPEQEFDFYDIHGEDGFCINESEPFWSMPSRNELKEYIEEVINYKN